MWVPPPWFVAHYWSLCIDESLCTICCVMLCMFYLCIVHLYLWSDSLIGTDFRPALKSQINFCGIHNTRELKASCFYVLLHDVAHWSCMCYTGLYFVTRHILKSDLLVVLHPDWDPMHMLTINSSNGLEITVILCFASRTVLLTFIPGFYNLLVVILSSTWTKCRS